MAQNEKDDVAQRFVENLERECHICGGTLGDDRVWDHCHITGKFRGAAHNDCNLNYRVPPKFVDIIFHNLSRYDSHLFIKKLGGEIKCISNTQEEYISFSKNILIDTYTDKDGNEKENKIELRFLDSFRFMGSSLDRSPCLLATTKVSSQKITFTC